jgi:hypothetical protein
MIKIQLLLETIFTVPLFECHSVLAQSRMLVSLLPM